MITVYLPADLAGAFQAPSRVELPARSLADMVRELDARHPGMRHWLTESDGRFRQHLSVFVGGVRLNEASSDGHPLAEGEDVFVLRAVSGG
ncbi:MAG: MoaD/ThiS family protein [Clostridia bacterium]